MKTPLLYSTIVIGSLVLVGATHVFAQSLAGPTPAELGLGRLVPSLGPLAVEDTPIPGLKLVRAGGRVVYMSEDGKYLVAGDIIDVDTKQNLTDTVRAQIRADSLKTSNQADHILYGPANNARKVYVFTDVSCGYCQRFHAEVPKLTAMGITVEYIAWPRGGPQGPGYGQMQAVWCAKDRASALDQSMEGKELPVPSCSHPLRASYEFGESLEVQGTPAIFDANGNHLGGYVTADRIAAALDDPASVTTARVDPAIH